MTTELRVKSSAIEARRRLDLLQRRTKNPTAAWKEVGALLSKETQRQFETRGANLGTPWAPLAPATIRQKLAQGFSRQMLVRTFAMKRGFTDRPMDIEVYAGRTARFGSSSKIAKFQHGGTMRGGKQHIPARPILKLTPHLRREIRKIVRRHLLKGF